MVAFTGRAERLTDADISAVADTLGCDEAAVRAVVEVETRGSGFDRQGRLKALFEPHRFYALLGDTPKRAKAVRAGLAYAKQGTKPYPADSYPRIKAAMAIDEAAALKATSWGLPQIMGSNCRMAGFDSPQAMLAAFVDSEGAQLQAMAAFIQSAGLDEALAARDWKRFARGYNGPKYAVNAYDSKLGKAYVKFSRLAARPVGFVAVPETESEDGERDFHPVQDEPATVEPNVVAGGYSRAVVEAVQRQLCEMGYFDVGLIDGNPGGKTAGAIAGFMTDRGFGPDGELNETSLAEIGTAYGEEPRFFRPIAARRANATVAEVSRTVPAARSSWAAEQAGKLWTWFTGGGAVATFGAAQTDTGHKALASLAAVPGYVWLALAAVAGFVVWRLTAQTTQAVVADYRIGKRS